MVVIPPPFFFLFGMVVATSNALVAATKKRGLSSRLLPAAAFFAVLFFLFLSFSAEPRERFLRCLGYRKSGTLLRVRTFFAFSTFSIASLVVSAAFWN